MRMRATVVGLILVASVAVPARPALAGACYERSQLESDLAGATNAARRHAGLPALVVDPQLSQVAELHSYWMQRKNRLYHSNRLGWKVTNWNLLGENVGVGSSIASLQRAFMESPTHRKNVLEPRFTYVGVSVASARDRLWVTVVFESRSNPGTRLDMRSC